jgi:hypothetical protein
MSTVGSLFIAATLFMSLTPILTGYRGFFNAKLSGFGFTAEVKVDGHKEDDKPD